MCHTHVHTLCVVQLTTTGSWPSDHIQSFAGYLSIEIGKDLACSCGLLNRLCSAFIRFGVVVT